MVAALLFCYIVYDGLTNRTNLLSEQELRAAELAILEDGRFASKFSFGLAEQRPDEIVVPGFDEAAAVLPKFYAEP